MFSTVNLNQFALIKTRRKLLLNKDGDDVDIEIINSQGKATPVKREVDNDSKFDKCLIVDTMSDLLQIEPDKALKYLLQF